MMKNLHRILISLSFLVLLSMLNVLSVSAQHKVSAKERKQMEKYFAEKYNIPYSTSTLKGGAVGSPITSLDAEYCSTVEYVDITIPDPSKINPTTASIDWKIYTNVAGPGLVYHPEWGEVLGSDENMYLRFYPSRVDGIYNDDKTIWIQFAPLNAGGVNTGVVGTYTYGELDNTVVYKAADKAGLTSDVTSVCAGNTIKVTQDNSEDGYSYQLMLDGSSAPLQPPFDGIDGTSYSWNVSIGGEYTVRAVRVDAPSCPEFMDGTLDLTIHPNPTLSKSADATICDGQTTTLSASSTDPDVSFEWSEGTNTHAGDTWDVSPSSTTTYTVTVTNNTTLCSASADVIVTVNNRPTATISGNASICNGIATDLDFTLTGVGPFDIEYVDDLGGTFSTTAAVGATSATVSVTPGVNTVYTLSSVVDNGNTCSSIAADISGSATISVNPSPTANITGTPTICNGESTDINITLTGVTPWDVTYSDGSGNTTITINSSPYNLSVNPSANTTYSLVSVKDGSCDAVPADLTGSATVTVNPRPTSITSGDATICDGDNTDVTISMTGTGPFNLTYLVDATPVTVNGVASPYVFSVSPSVGTTVYSVQSVQDANCSSLAADNTGSATVTVNDKPTGIIDGDVTVCNGSPAILSFTLTGVGPWDIVYTDGTSDFLTTANNANHTESVTPSSNTTYTIKTLTDTGTGCDADPIELTGSAIVLLNARPTGVISGTPTICNGEVASLSVVLTGTAPWNITYNNGSVDATVTANSSPYVLDVSPSINTNYTLVSVTDVDCSSIAADLSGTASVSVNPRPTSVISGDATLCDGDNTDITVVMNGTGPFNLSYLTNGAPTVVNNVISPFIFNVSPAGGSTTVYSVQTVTDQLCTTIPVDNSGTATVVVNERPTGIIDGDVTVCDGTAASLSFVMTGVGPWNIVFTDGISDFNTTAVGVNHSVSVTPSNNTTYTLKSINDTGSGCAAIAADMTGSAIVTVNARPTGVISGNETICLTETASLNIALTGVAPWSITYNDGAADVTVNTSSNPYSLDVSPSSTSSYSLVALTDGNCVAQAGDLSGTGNVTVNMVTASFSVSAPAPGITTICAGTAVTFNAAAADGSGNYSYEFHIVDGLADTAIPNGNNPIYTTSGITDGNTIYVVVTDMTTGCKDTSGSIMMTVVSNPVPNLTITSPGGATICLGEEVDFLVTPTGFSRYVFIRNGIETLQDDASNSYKTSSLSNGDQISVIAYAGTCFGNSPATTMNVHPLPTSDLAASKTTVCQNETVTFTATPGGTGPFMYQFYVGSVAQGVQASNTFDHSSTSDFSVEVEVFDGNNCSVLSTPQDITISLPVADLVVDNTTVCDTDEATFTASGGVSYEFFVNGNPEQGPGVETEFVSTTLNNNDNVTVEVTNAVGCAASHSGIIMTVNPIPTVTIGSSDVDNIICEGDEVTFSASGGDLFEWFVDGTSMQGPNATNQYVTSSLADGEKVSALVSYSSSNCGLLTPEIATTVNPLPIATLDVSPATTVISGTLVTFTAGGGDDYEFLLNGAVDQVRSSTNVYTNDKLNDGDIVSVNVYNAFDCSVTMSSTITILEGILPKNISATATEYCNGDGGVSIYVEDPQHGITYELLRTSDNSQEGASIMFDTTAPVAVQWDNVSGTDEYRVEAYYSAVITERLEMNNRLTITSHPLPTPFVLSSPSGASATGCNAGGGHDVELSGTQTDFIYRLLVNGVETDQQIGTGAAITFAGNLVVGTYTIQAEDNVSGCTEMMTGSFDIISDGTDVAFNLSVVSPADPADPSDGRYCAGAVGVELELDGSLDNTVNYKLYLDGVDTGVSVPGANGVISMGTVTDEGAYTVRVESGTGCQFPMTGLANVSIVSMPVELNIISDNFVDNTSGHYCDGDAGVMISVDGQEAGVEYTLFLDGTSVETITGIATPAAPLAFSGPLTAEGNYTVSAVVPQVSCTTPMANSIDVVVDPLPVAYDVFNDDNTYCVGESTTLYILDSEADVEYTWEDGLGVTGTWQNGNNSRLDFIINTEGDYNIIARRTDGITSCTSTMNNGPFNVIEKPLPVNVPLKLAELGTGCDNGDSLYVEGPEVGVTYVLVKQVGVDYYPAVGIPTAVSVDGSDVGFERVIDTNNAQYTIQAIKDGCSIYSSSPVILVNVPGVIAKQTVTGAGEICNGDPGVMFGLADSEIGVDYELWKSGDGAPMQSVAGTDNAIEFGEVIDEGEYYVMGVNGSCDTEMTNRVQLNVNPLPVAFSMFGSGQTCDLATEGALIGLVKSEADFTYRLQFDDGSGVLSLATTIPGRADMDSLKYKVNQEGTYTFMAISDKGCTSNMNGSVIVIESSAPLDQIIDPAMVTTYCGGSAGVEFKLTDNEVDVTYQVRDASDNVVSEVVGTNTDLTTAQELSFPDMIAEGAYTIWKTRGGDACQSITNNGETITVVMAVEPTDHNVVADNENVCGSTGAVISLEDFEPGRSYRIEDTSGPIAGSDTISVAPFEWTVVEPGGTSEIYEVYAIAGTVCDKSMGSVSVNFNEAPNVFNVFTVDDALLYCEDGDSIIVGIDNTQSEVAYMLVDTVDITTALDVIIGNGGTQTYVKHMGEGGYTVKAVLFKTGCELLYNDTLEIQKSYMPTVDRDVFCGSIAEPQCTVEDALCIDPSESDVEYILYMDGVEIERIAGDGSQICFTPVVEDGEYNIVARSLDGVNCDKDFGDPITYDRKDFGQLLAVDDTLNIRANYLEDTVSVRANDGLVYIVAGESAIIPYDSEGYFDASNDKFIVDSCVVDFKETIDPSTTNVRFALLDIDAEGKSVEVLEIENSYVGVYKINEFTGELTLNKTPGFFGKDKIEYVIYNTNEEFSDDEDSELRKATASVYVFVGNETSVNEKTFVLPNAFSPNGDDINDYYVVTDIETGGIKADKSRLEIFNRWGTLVYRSNGNKYGEDDEWWDGTSSTSNMVSIGAELPKGTYFYIFSVEVNVDGKIETKEFNGYIELRR